MGVLGLHDSMCSFRNHSSSRCSSVCHASGASQYRALPELFKGNRGCWRGIKKQIGEAAHAAPVTESWQICKFCAACSWAPGSCSLGARAPFGWEGLRSSAAQLPRADFTEPVCRQQRCPRERQRRRAAYTSAICQGFRAFTVFGLVSESLSL